MNKNIQTTIIYLILVIGFLLGLGIGRYGSIKVEKRQEVEIDALRDTIDYYKRKEESLWLNIINN